ncbi:MAG TPA: hypothetical protein PKE26_09055 [Kiritimatiellia bacterium]|nr:hypothetical protein [Kiritimatiellia bacterium]HMO99239.1 hypothetical protein [Kiritimatiellia bacterium]HMO99244.1 hypothetical protein [Kiritimatiellia bacterium]
MTQRDDMSDDNANLGTCPACHTALVRNRKIPSDSVSFEAVAPPRGAYFSELRLPLRVVWCPACGWVQSVESKGIGLTWRNDEYDTPR